MTTKKGRVLICPTAFAGSMAIIRRLLLLGLVSCLLCSTSVAETWKLLAESTSNDKFYVDTDSIVRIERNGVLYWEKTVRKDRSYILNRKASWPDRTYVIRTITKYNRFQQLQSCTSYTSYAPVVNDIVPGSVCEIVWLYLFKKELYNWPSVELLP